MQTNKQHRSKGLIKTGLLALGSALALSLACQTQAQEGPRALPAAANPPADALMADESKRQIPEPPGRTDAKALVEQFRKQPGGAAHLDALNKGRIMGLDKQSQVQPGASGTVVEQAFSAIVDLVIPRAEAATLSAVLTPTVTSLGSGRRDGLYTSSLSARAYIYGALVSNYYPSNSYVYLPGASKNTMGYSLTSPYAMVQVYIPSSGNYSINANIYTSGAVNIHNYENGQYPLLSSVTGKPGWADYPTVQYLSAGYHYFCFVLPSGGYISRFTVDQIPQVYLSLG